MVQSGTQNNIRGQGNFKHIEIFQRIGKHAVTLSMPFDMVSAEKLKNEKLSVIGQAYPEGGFPARYISIFAGATQHCGALHNVCIDCLELG